VLWATGPNADGTIHEYEAKDFDTYGFYIDPPYCDKPGAYPTPGIFRVQHRGSSAQSLPIDYEGVIPIVTVQGGELEKVFADQDPVLDLVKTSIDLSYYWDSTRPDPDVGQKITSPYVATTATHAKIKQATKTIKVTSAYPPYTLDDVLSDGVVTVYFGALKDTVPAFDKDAAGAKKGYIAVKKYMQVVEVVVKDLGGAFAFDDETEIFAIGGTMPKELDEKLASVTFDVAYQPITAGGADKEKTEEVEHQTKTWTQFKNNVAYAIRVGNITTSAQPVNWAAAGTVKTAAKSLGQVRSGWEAWDVDILDYDEDGYWKLWLEYVPLEYLKAIAGADPAYNARVDVNLPVATFDEAAVRVRPGLNAGYEQAAQAMLPYKSAPVPMTQNWLDIVTDKWVFSATYTLDRDTKTRYFGFTTGMFQQGYRSAGDVINLTGGLSAGVLPASGQVIEVRDWSLPVYYRGFDISDEDGVVVRIIRTRD